MLDTGAAWKLLHDACPSFERSSEALSLDDDDGPYIRVAALTRHLVRSLADGRVEELAAACSAIEQVLKEGDEEARKFANHGFLEDITNGNLYQPGGPSRTALLPLLGPRARENSWVLNIEHGLPS